MSVVSTRLAVFARNTRLFVLRTALLRQTQSVLRLKARLASYYSTRVGALLIPSALVARAWFGFSAAKEDEKMAEGEDISQLKATIDELFSNNENQKIVDQLKPMADSKNDEILWRLARSTYGLAQEAESSKQEAIYNEAFEYAKQALELNDKNFACHKWYAILLDIVGGFKGTKKRIENAYVVKEHFLKAHELNPDDATSLHTLGMWHFLFADLPWYQRKVASVIFATPPTATYQEALDYFEQAEAKDAGFYSMNLLMIGKTYARLGKKKEAAEHLQKVLERTVVTVDDGKANEEAKTLLKSVK